MKVLDFFLDLASPESYLAFEHLPQALQGLSYRVRYLPVCAANLPDTQRSGQGSDAADVACLAAQAQAWGVPLQMPVDTGFDVRPFVRLAWACARQGTPSRYVVEAVLHHLWRNGQEASDAARFQALAQQLQAGDASTAANPQAEAWLAQAAEAARQLGVGHAPAWVLDGQVFHGLQAWPSLRQKLELTPE